MRYTRGRLTLRYVALSLLETTIIVALSTRETRLPELDRQQL